MQVQESAQLHCTDCTVGAAHQPQVDQAKHSGFADVSAGMFEGLKQARQQVWLQQWHDLRPWHAADNAADVLGGSLQREQHYGIASLARTVLNPEHACVPKLHCSLS